MAKTRIGLDIGSTAVRIVELEVGDAPAVVRLGQVPLPLGAVEAGEVRAPDLVGEALRRLLEISGIEAGPVHLGVGSARVIAREVSVPWLPEKEIRGALGFQMQEFIPMPPDEAVMDFIPFGTREADGQRLQDMLLVAAPKSAVLAHIAAAELAGLVPLGVDFNPLAAVRATTPTDPNEAEALVDIGGHVTSVALHRGGAVRLVRVLSKAGRDVSGAIASSLGVSEEVAELLKRGESEALKVQGLDRGRARAVALEAAQPLVEEIASTIEFSLRQMPELRVSRIVMTGGGSHLDGIVELLDARVPLPVERARAFGRAVSRLAPDIDAVVESAGTFSVAIGLALPDRPARRGSRAA